ncbi:MAG TPA: TonB-dependent receptor [Candidatus Acidoferrum sp.]|nr:TonB-dependent receptor [Candidatus Acidoferrum sp.]
MRSTLLASAFALCAWLFPANTSVLAQGTGTSGQVRGMVTDATGGTVPKATVEIEDAEKGVRRTALTGSDGEFQVTGLPPSTYSVTVRLAGFQTETHRNVVVNVGQTLILDFQLRIATGTAQIEVTSELPAVETARSSQADTLVQQYIADLPIGRRDYLTFTLLAPGVSNSNTIADNADFRVKQTPQSGLSFYGSNGRGNSVTVDGGEANDDAGGVRLNLSQDAVQEFQINRSNYGAELGGASGATINIVSKSGTNDLHGSLFGFFRNDAMDARDPFAFTQALVPGQTFSLTAQGTPIKDSLNRQQFGGNVGFPLRKDSTFLFLAYEGLRSDAQDSVPLLTNSNIFAPTLSQQTIIGNLAAQPATNMVPCITTNPSNPLSNPIVLPAPTCAFALSSLLTVNPAAGPNPFIPPIKSILDPYIVNQFAANGGLFPFPIRSNDFSARLDHRFSDSNQGFLRYSFAHLTEKDPDLQALTALSRGTSELAWDSTLQGSWFHQFNASMTNEARIQWNIYQFNVDTNDPGGPGLDVEGFGFFGRGIFLPSHTTGRRYEFADNLMLVRGHHTIKFGFDEVVRGNNTTSQTFFPGRFEFLELPGALVSLCLEAPAACGVSAPESSISTLQSWSLGLPAFYEQGFGNPKYVQTRPFTALYAQDTWQVRSNFTLNYGLRYELDSQYGPLHTPKKNFGPRVSFSWDPLNDHKTVIRAGYGIFYSPIYAQIPGVVQVLGNVNGTRTIANTLVTILGAPTGNSAHPFTSSAEIFQTLYAEGFNPANPLQNNIIGCGSPPAGQFACLTPADLTQFGLTVANTGPLPPGTVLFAGQNNYKSPMSQQVSLGIEREIGAGFSVSANYIYVHTTHLPVAIDTNLLPGAPVCPTAGPAACGQPGVGANGLPTNGLAFQDWGAPACAATPALCFADPTHTILQNNVYSSLATALYQGGIFELKKRFSNHFLLMANYTYSKALDESTDFNSDYSPFNATCLRCDRSVSDFDQRHKVVIAGVFESPWEKSRILGGFQLSPVFNYNSGHPFNLLAGADINGDGHFTNDRPPGAPRNSGLGPSYYDFDMRLSRAFKLGEKASLQFTAEAFNLANHTNYASVNNIVGAAFAPPFKVRGITPGTVLSDGTVVSPSTPLGFTAAFPKRQIQLGARLTF